MLANLILSGALSMDCPHGKMQVDTNDDQGISVYFENGKVFRYFLSTIRPYFKPSVKSLGMLNDLEQTLSVSIGERQILNKPKGGSAKLSYRKGAWQYLLWKFGL